MAEPLGLALPPDPSLSRVARRLNIGAWLPLAAHRV
jgi:hypothetical protein